jgi:uracil-DNA glycosylase
VSCVPPQNKPLPEEITRCRTFLTGTILAMPRLAGIVALGRIAHESVIRAFGEKLSMHPFAHGRQHALKRDAEAITLFDSYHCSRYNTNTGVLTEKMFHALFDDVGAALKRADR